MKGPRQHFDDECQDKDCYADCPYKYDDGTTDRSTCEEAAYDASVDSAIDYAREKEAGLA